MEYKDNGGVNMKRRDFMLYSLGLLSSATNLENLLASTQNKNNMYAKEVVDDWTKEVINPENALGNEDSKYAKILPGGELTLKMEQPFPPITFVNDGIIAAKGDSMYSLAALVPMEYVDDKEGIKYAWREIIPNLTGGFKIPKSCQTLVDTIKIINPSEEPVYIDAVIGVAYF